MSLHGLTSITLGVPDVDAVASYYEDFGLRRVGDRPGRGLVFATADGGEQLALRPAERRRLLEIGIGADDPDDLGRVEAGLRRLGAEFERDAAGLRVRDPNSALQVSVQVSPWITEAAAKQEPTNGPGRPDRPNGPAPAIERAGRVQPRRLGHVVVGSLDQEASQRFFTEGLGFKVSDRVPGLASFMRCSTDHHNLLVQQAPLNFLHHTAWEVDDIDEVGRGATAMLEGPGAARLDDLAAANVSRFARWLTQDGRARLTGDYLELWRWSVDRLDEFWAAVWDYFGVRAATPYQRVLSGSVMPDVQWFTGAQVSYVEHLLRGRDPERVVLIDARESTRPGAGPVSRLLTWGCCATRSPAWPRRFGIWAWSPETGLQGTCRTRPRRSSPSWPRPAWAPSGPVAARTTRLPRRPSAWGSWNRRC